MFLELIKPTDRAKVLARLSILVTAFVITDVMAFECETMQFQKNKSQGTSIRNNSCKDDDKVSVGSIFAVNPGGRLWLKTTTTDNNDFQLICQNRAANKVEVKFSSQFLPWIMPKDLGQCSTWVNNKLNCVDKNGTKNSFICAIAAIKRPEYLKVTTLERTTSVKMRTVTTDQKKTAIAIEPEPEIINAVVKFIRSEVGLCRDLYQVNKRLKASWNLDVLGRIEKLALTDGHYFEQSFLTCVESVINDYAYPKFTENVIFSAEL